MSGDNMWALIQDNKVAEVTDVDPAGRFHPSFEWVSCSGQVQVGMSFIDGIFKEQIATHLPEQERLWRDAELISADYELNKVQDGDINSIGSVGDWRTYRKLLRAWPESEDFPDTSKRPQAPK